jgi:UDP-glucose:(heptosyl)LPS alpha-1,3-glucosyltransferase
LNSALSRVLAACAERWCYRPQRLRAFAAVSRGVGREVERHFPGIETHITPNGVDVSRFRPDPDVRVEVRAELGVAETTFVALFVGGDWDRKGLALAIEGLARARIANAELWVVGRGDEKRFGALAGRHGVEARFFGMRDDAERFFQAADCFVLPTLYETFSLVAYEAAASALPVVASCVSGIDELLEGGSGIIVERDAGSIGRAISTLAADESLRRDLGTRGRERASTFDWQRSVASVVTLYRALGSADGAA